MLMKLSKSAYWLKNDHGKQTLQIPYDERMQSGFTELNFPFSTDTLHLKVTTNERFC